MSVLNNNTEVVIASVNIVFNPRAANCAHCPILETYARKQCRLTGEYIVEDKGIGLFCPLNISREDKDLITKENFKR